MRRYLKYLTAGLVLLISVWLILLRAQFAGVAINHWTPTADMAFARAAACSALLPDGRVLVAGGYSSSGVVNTAELYGSNGTFVLAAPMSQARAGAACTAMQDGRVLVTGGTDGASALATAEIYDPAADSWTSTGAMTVARSGHTSTLLPWGSVLIVGGDSNGAATSSVELYLLNGLFQTGGALSSARQNYAIAVMPNHQVIIAGGSDGNTALNTIDIFDADKFTVTPAGTMLVARTNFAAAPLLDGTVLITGGLGANGNVLASSEIYDPAKQVSTDGPQLPVSRANHQAYTLPNNGRVILVGGTTDYSQVLTGTDVYSPWTGKFASTAPMNTARSGNTAALLRRGGLVVAGGQNAGGYLTSSEVYGFATVETDQSDYAPGTPVIMTGSGWKPGEQVLIQVTAYPVDQHNIEFSGAAIADGTGQIKLTGFQVDKSHFGMRFLLNATGSESQAQTLFSDADTTEILLATESAGTLAFPSSVYFTMDVVNVTHVSSDTPNLDGALSVSDNGGTPIGVPFVSTGCSILSISTPCSEYTINFNGSTYFLAPGPHTLVFTYADGATFNGSTTTIYYTIAPVNVSIAPSGGGSIYYGVTPGSPNLSAIVSVSGSSYNGNPSGTITFSDGLGNSYTCTLATYGGVGSGQSSCSTSTANTLSAGTHNFIASYSGGGSIYNPITAGGPIVVTVTPDTTTTAVSPSPGSSQPYGTPITFTATVTNTATGSTAVPAGYVTFYDNGAVIGSPSLPLDPLLATASIVISTLSVGTHSSITATYVPSSPANFAASSSTAITYLITGDTTTTTIVAPVTSPPLIDTEYFGTTETFVIEVADTSVVAHPGGTVTLTDTSVPGPPAFVGSGTLTPYGVGTNTSRVSIPVSNLSGTAIHYIHAAYTPSSTSYNASDSTGADFTYIVLPALFTDVSIPVTGTAHPFNISISPTAVTLGQSWVVTLTAPTPYLGGVAPTGQVEVFYGDPATALPTTLVSLVNGSVSIPISASLGDSFLAPPTTKISWRYGGDNNYSTEAPDPDFGGYYYNLSVTQAPTAGTVVTIPPSPVTYGNQVIYQLTVTSTTAGNIGGTGYTATFADGGAIIPGCNSGTSPAAEPMQAGVATCQPTLPIAVGTHSITAQWSTPTGSVFAGSTGPTVAYVLTVNPEPTTTTLATSAHTTSLTSVVTYTATVAGTPVTPVTLGGGGTAGGVDFKDVTGVPYTLCSALALNGSGVATCNVTYDGTGGNGAGSHTIQAFYTPPTPGGVGTNSFVASSSAAVAVTVNKGNPTLSSLAVDAGAGYTTTPHITYGTAVKIHTLITPALPTPPYTGLVNFILDPSGVNLSLGSAALCVLLPTPTYAACTANGESVITSVVLPAGSHTIQANFLGDSNYNAASDPIVILVDKANLPAGDFQVYGSPYTGTYGGLLSIPAGVPAPPPPTVQLSAYGAGATPTGTVTMSAGGSQIGNTLTLVSGGADFNNSRLPASLNYGLVQNAAFNYSGDSNYNAATASAVINVLSATPVAIFATSGSPSNYNAPVKFTITLTAQPGSVGVPAGTVNFYDGASLMNASPVALFNGVASYTTTALIPASHTITAAYISDNPTYPNFTSPATTPTLTQVVNPAATTTTLQASTTSPSLNSTVIYTATVTSAYLTPGGTVTFNDVTSGTIALCSSVSLNGSGVATCSVAYNATVGHPELQSGPHTIQAVYTSNALTTWASSTSSPVTISVSLAPVTLGQVASDATNGCTLPVYCFTYGTPTDLSVPLSPANPSPAYTGSVQFLDNGVVIGTVSVVSSPGSAGPPVIPPSSIATLSGYKFLTAGTHNIRAQFLGDSNYTAAGPTAALSITVNKATPTVAAASDPVSAQFGRSFTTSVVTVTGAGTGFAAPTGTISLSQDQSGPPAITVAIGSAATLTAGAGDTSTVSVTATLPVSIPVGTGEAFKYSYGGDSNYLPADTGTTDHITVYTTAIPYTVTSATIASFPAGQYPVYGQTIVLTVTLAALAGAPANSSDQIDFKEGATTVCGPVLKVSDNVFTCNVPNVTNTSPFSVSGSPHTIGIAFDTGGPDPTYTLAGTGGGGSTALTFSVIAAPTTTTLTANPVSALPGQSVTFTATVAVPLPGVATPAGTVSFTQDTIAGPVPIASGSGGFCTNVTVVYNVGLSLYQATCTVPPTLTVPTPPWFVSPGAYGIHATFTPGDTKTAASIGNLAYTVNKVQPGIILALTTGANASVYGQPLTYTVTISPPAGTTQVATGQVTFYDGGVALIGSPANPGTLATSVACGTNNACASITVSNTDSNVLTVGTHAITGMYGGDSNYGQITSSVYNQAVTTNGTTTGGEPSGLYVSVSYDNTVPNAPVYGQPITLKARVTAQNSYVGIPSGTVTFTDGGTGIPGATATLVPCTTSTTCDWATATLVLPSGSLPGLSTGGHTLGANYHGDSNFTSSSTGSNTQALTINPATTTTTVTAVAPNPVAYGWAALTLTAQVTPASLLVTGTRVGVIAFYDNPTCSSTPTLNPSINLLGTSGPVNGSGYGSIQVPVVGATPGFQNPAAPLTIVGTHCIVAVYEGASGTPADPNFATSTSTPTTPTLTINRATTTTTVVSNTGWASVYGQPVTFTATITAASSVGLSPGSTATFVDGTASISAPITLTGSGNSVSAAQTFPLLSTTNALLPGNHSISVNYAGDLNYLPSTGAGAAAQVVSKANTTTVVTSSCLSTSTGCTVGQQLTLTALVTVNPPGNGAPLATNPTGTVLFYNGSTALQCSTSGALTQSTGIATCLLPNGLPQGNLALTAVYSGDSNFNTSTSAIVTQGINTVAVSVTVTPSMATIIFGQTVSFSVVVKPIDTTLTLANPPAGTITCYDGGAQFWAGALSGGSATCQAAGPFGVGTHAITASFTPSQDQTGHVNYQPNVSQAVPVIVSQIPTSLSLTSSWNMGYAGQPITFTAQIQANEAPGVPYPTGTVSFFDGTYASTSNLLGVAGLTSGVALLQPSTLLAPGLHQILAVYQGDGNYVTSQSNFVAVTVNTATTTTTIASSVNPSVVGQAVTFTITIGVGYPSTFGPSGQMQLWDNAVALGTAQSVSNGTITVTIPGFTPGTHNIYATFLANGNFATSTSPTLTQIVNKASTVTTLAALPVSSTSTQQVVLTAVVVVQAPGAGIPTGTVQFVDTTFNKILGTAPLTMVGGVYTATITTNQLVQSGAPQLLTATYSGDANFATSTSAPQGQTVFTSQITVTNAASYYSSNFSADSWATAWGTTLANSTLGATTTPLPTSLAGSTVQVTDSAGVQRLAPLSFVSPGQINFMIPSNSAAGLATVTATNGFGAAGSTIIIISPTAPGLFSQDSSGTGLAAGQFIIVHANGTQDNPVPIAQYNAGTGQWAPVPIAPAATDQVYLVLYGTGIRYAPSSSSVTAKVNGQSVPVAYAGPQAQFAGEDQVNLGALPSFAGAGTVSVQISVNGEPSNTVTVNFK